MSDLVIEFIELYASNIPYLVFFLMLYGKMEKAKKAFLYLIPYNLLFLIIYRSSLLIPNELAGMLFKSFSSRLLIVLFFKTLLNLPFLRTLMQSYIASVVLVFTELLLSTVFDTSYFTNYLSAEANIYYLTFLSLFHSLIETLLMFPFVKLIKRNHKITDIPTRYILIALISLVIVVFEGALLYYFNNSANRLPLPFAVILILLAVIATSLPVYILLNEERLKQVVSHLPAFMASQDHMKQQLEYLDQEASELQKARNSLETYKNTGDFSYSINDVFHTREDFIDNLYTDNPVINTLLMSYADRFEKQGISYSFHINCSTYTSLSDYFMIYILSGLLDTTFQYADLTLNNTANIYTVSFKTAKEKKQDLLSFLKSASILKDEYQAMHHKMNDDTLLLNLTV